MQAARILVDGQSDLVLDYGIPPEAGDVKPGCRVQVPLRNRTATGTVLTLSEPAPAWKDRLKPILKLIDPEPLISPVMMNLASWAADYYSVALDQMIRCLLPETVRQENTAEKCAKWCIWKKLRHGRNWTPCTAKHPGRPKCWIISHPRNNSPPPWRHSAPEP